jgi:hypothetical protein
MTVGQRLRLWADEIRAIANEGLQFEGDNPYNVRRCRRLLRLAAELFALQDVREADEIERAYHADLRHLAPYPGGDAAIFNDDGQIHPTTGQRPVGHAGRVLRGGRDAG